MSDQPLSHVLRNVPPWAKHGQTVCGRPAGDVTRVIPQTDAEALVKLHGKQRAAFLLCMTCSTNQSPTFEAMPAWCTADWAVRMGGRWRETDPADAHLLRCLARLVEVHREEFDAMVDASDDLTARRSDRKPKAVPTRSRPL